MTQSAACRGKTYNVKWRAAIRCAQVNVHAKMHKQFHDLKVTLLTTDPQSGGAVDEAVYIEPARLKKKLGSVVVAA